MTLPQAKSEGAKGVIDMGLLNVIRKLRLRQGLAIREIERRTGVDLSRICAAPSARLGHLAFEGQGAFASQC